MCQEFGCLPSEIEREDWGILQGIQCCRAYWQAKVTYDSGKPLTQAQSVLLTQIDEWRRDEDAECG